MKRLHPKEHSLQDLERLVLLECVGELLCTLSTEAITFEAAKKSMKGMSGQRLLTTPNWPTFGFKCAFWAYLMEVRVVLTSSILATWPAPSASRLFQERLPWLEEVLSMATDKMDRYKY